jgi:putative SOS response-associated peptidase YedK
MCNRYRQVKTNANLSLIFGARDLSPAPSVDGPGSLPGELFPGREAIVVRKAAGERVLDIMRWGFPPPANGRAPVTNVRNLTSPFWRSALKSPERRCLVPVTSFCEWEGEVGSKRDRWFSLPAADTFAFAGIWRPLGSDEAAAGKGPYNPARAYAFLTCDPNPLVAPIHPKAMPVILQPEDYDAWLDGEVESACALAQPFPSQLMSVA